ncbi:Hypothetical predicted protein [Mytilus galloprovincialis]|uniref:Superoxide dismutase copper/zinc binding domain-containing protein n=1 Tax=Mytilus galloprovincialis TaxID=29158 RepID=A0A8B6GAP7_MYTGA|nr:Hypothetical predicted protein [Mytilus galloprovincialis]
MTGFVRGVCMACYVRDEDNDRLCAWCVHGLLLVRDEDNDRLCAWCVHGLLLVCDTDAHREIIPRLNLRAEHGVRGNIHFTQKGNGPVELELNIDGFKMNAASASLINGFYTHTFGDQTDFCDSLGSHYNHHGKLHGSKECGIRFTRDQKILKKAEMAEEYLAVKPVLKVLAV